MRLMLEYPGACALDILDTPTDCFNGKQPLWRVLSYLLWEQDKKLFRSALTQTGAPVPSQTKTDFIDQITQHAAREESHWNQQSYEVNKHIVEEKRHKETVGVARHANWLSCGAIIISLISLIVSILFFLLPYLKIL